MAKFQIGDMVRMPSVPLPPVRVLEVRLCQEPSCPYRNKEIFRFTSPDGLGDDWMHTEEFEKVQ